MVEPEVKETEFIQFLILCSLVVSLQLSIKSDRLSRLAVGNRGIVLLCRIISKMEDTWSEKINHSIV